MTVTEIHILLVEDNPADARLIYEMIKETRSTCHLDHVERLDNALKALVDNSHIYDVILLDLSLPDSQGLETVKEMRTHAPATPIVVLTGYDDDSTGLSAVQEGAQDYLIKGEVRGGQLLRSIRYAVERHQMHMMLRKLSLTDELTGLYNRRGFMTLAEQQIKLTDRAHRELLVVYVDVNGMKTINDTFGHHEGDRALKDTAVILKGTFRASDIIARVGGDEFVVLAIEASSTDKGTISDRLEKVVAEHNLVADRTYGKLSLSFGFSCYIPNQSQSLDQLINEADQAMYRHKSDYHGSDQNNDLGDAAARRH